MNNLHPIALRPETEPEHPLTYRQEIASPLFQRLRAGESGVIIGAASMGKSRLLQFIQRRDVQRHYLAAMAESTLLIAADCNRLAAFSAWALHELLLTALIEASGEYEQTRDLSERHYQWRNEAIRSRSRLLTQRHVELALHIFCKERGLRIGFILDEFDEAYRRLPSQALANLRALRDQHKYQLSYLLFTRDDPKYLRNPDQCEGFYELISRGVNGLSPYGEEDGRRVIQQICARRYHEVGHLEESILRALLQLSGGHPGLIAALLDAHYQQTHWHHLA